MPRLAAEGNVKLYKVPSISDKAAPTVTEMGAGVNLTPMLPTNGVDITWTQNNASRAMLDEFFTIEAVGTESASITLTGLRDDGATDPFWDAFSRGENFFLVVARFGFSGSDGEPAIGDKVEVYPVQSHRPVPSPPAENEFQEATVSLAVNGVPELKAVLAAAG